MNFFEDVVPEDRPDLDNNFPQDSERLGDTQCCRCGKAKMLDSDLCADCDWRQQKENSF